jgi:hypothetical protein
MTEERPQNSSTFYPIEESDCRILRIFFPLGPIFAIKKAAVLSCALAHFRYFRGFWGLERAMAVGTRIAE